MKDLSPLNQTGQVRHYTADEYSRLLNHPTLIYCFDEDGCVFGAVPRFKNVTHVTPPATSEDAFADERLREEAALLV